MTYKIVHWGTGATGRLGLSAILDRADFELVGLYVTNPEKAGKDAGELIGRAPVGVIATQDLDSIIAMKPDVLSYFGNGNHDPIGTLNVMARFLAAGINVVTPSVFTIISRETAEPEALEILEPAMKSGNSSFYASGIDPGFATTQMPITAYSISNRIDQVRLQEFANYGPYPDEFTMRTIWGFGGPLDTETPVSQGLILKRMWGSTLKENARALGVDVQELQTRFHAAPARADRDTAFGVVKQGTTSAVWFQLIGIEDGTEKIILEHINWVHLDDVLADWPAPPNYRGSPSPVSYRTRVEGDPTYDLELQLPDDIAGLTITAMHCLNAVPVVVAAEPGIVTQARLVPYAIGPRR